MSILGIIIIIGVGIAIGENIAETVKERKLKKVRVRCEKKNQK